jgi:MFS family permease
VGFLLAIVIFAVLQSVLAPWLARVAQRNAPAFLGGIGIVSTFVALVVTALIPGAGLTIGLPWWTWIVAPMIVWVVTAIAAFLLPAVLLKKKVEARREAEPPRPAPQMKYSGVVSSARLSSPARRARAVAGTPTSTESAGASRVTTAFAPTTDPAPIAIGPRIFAPAPTATPSPRGCRLPASRVRPPSVTPW